VLKFVKIKPISKDALEKMGFSWHRDGDGEYIVADKLICISKDEAEAYYKVTNELYKMYEVGAQYVIDNELFEELDIPPSLVLEIKKSWREERENHLYGRFDLSGGLDNKPIKLIEFNADTPTLLLETVLIQTMMLKYNDLKNAEQFNNIYEAIASKFVKIAASKKAEFSRFLFSSVQGIEEERVTTQLLESMAKDRGLMTKFEYLEEVDVQNSYDFWFKLYPWEDMLNFTPNAVTSMLNPSYTLLYQSKGMLAILYKLFPTSPYLLKCDFKPLKEKYVKKRMFGREGANIDIVDVNGDIVNSTDGIYDEYKAIYQEYTAFVQDEEKNHYQAGVFYSDGACGVGFRRGREILDDMSQFVGHMVE